MEKMKMETPDWTSENIEKIGKLFPNCITETKDAEGNLRKAINFDVLKQMLSKDVIQGNEAYEFTWVGKKASMVEANKPIRKTLRPCKEESKDWDNTENLYIEGDNLDVLKLLQESYLNSIKMIYIDPPYNTGNDFIYNDDFKVSREEYQEETGIFDEGDNRLFKNTDSNGRFHSDWCCMMYPRLMLARNLLCNDGVIFISIDDNEQENLKKICDEVFGESNFIALLPTIMNLKGNNDQFAFSGTHEHTLVYCKSVKESVFYELYLEESEINEWDEDEYGLYKKGANLKATGINAPKEKRPNLFFPLYIDENHEVSIEKKDGFSEVLPLTDGVEMSWRWSRQKFKEEMHNVIVVENNGAFSLYKKQRNKDDSKPTKKPKTIFNKPEYSSGNGSSLIKTLFNNKIFDFPKPLELIKDFITIGTRNNDVVLDFFSGSSTTAHAVIELNAEDGASRKFIMVQLPEKTNEKSEAYKTGYKNICEIGKERIRRAGGKIKEDNKDKAGIDQLDTGFRVLKLDDTNMKDVYYSPNEISQGILDHLESNIKEDRIDLDLLFSCLLEWGLPLSRPYTSEVIDGVTVHIYNEGDLIACFNKDVPQEVIREIAKRKPLRVVFRDSSFKDSPDKINVEEIFKLLSPETSIKVL
jgi:adenine-specific DNA-methyltransferase